jgi:adenosine deaminase
MFGAGLLDEYEIARSELGLSDDQLAALARTSAQTSGAPALVIATATAGIDAWLSRDGRRDEFSGSRSRA